MEKSSTFVSHCLPFHEQINQLRQKQTYNDLQVQFLKEEELVLGEFKENLKKLRIKKKLTLQQLCDKIEACGGYVTKSGLSLYEQGKREPSLYALIYIAKALDVSIDYLVGNSDFSITNVNEFIRQETGLNQKVIDKLKEDMKTTKRKKNSFLHLLRAREFSLFNIINLCYGNNQSNDIFNLLTEFFHPKVGKRKKVGETPRVKLYNALLSREIPSIYLDRMILEVLSNKMQEIRERIKNDFKLVSTYQNNNTLTKGEETKE